MWRAVVTAVLWLVCSACRTQSPGHTGSSRDVAAGVTTILQSVGRACPGLRFGGLEEFRGERLYDYMNGAAVTYFEHHFRVMAACDVYDGSIQAKVELFEMGSAADSQAVFGEFESLGGRKLAVGQDSRYWPGIEPETILRRGPYFVRLLVYAQDPAAAEKLAEKTASAIDRELREAGGE